MQTKMIGVSMPKPVYDRFRVQIAEASRKAGRPLAISDVIREGLVRLGYDLSDPAQEFLPAAETPQAHQ